MKTFSDDIEVWKQMRSGQQNALATLFKRYYPSMYHYAMNICQREDLVKDCLQDVFAYIWEKRENLSEPLSVKAYLLVAVRRAVLKKLEKIRKIESLQQNIFPENEPGFFPLEMSPNFDDQQHSQFAQVKFALDKIPPRMREALYLKVDDGLSYNDIARIMKISPQVARNYVCDALQRLRNLTANVAE